MQKYYELRKLLKAIDITNKVFQDRGFSSGDVKVIDYLKYKKLNPFTSENDAREIASKIDYNVVINEVYMKLLSNASKYANKGCDKTNNKIIDSLIRRAKELKNTAKLLPNEVEEMKEYIINIIEMEKDSDALYEALKGDIEISESNFPFKEEAKLLKNYAVLIESESLENV